LRPSILGGVPHTHDADNIVFDPVNDNVLRVRQRKFAQIMARHRPPDHRERSKDRTRASIRASTLSA
jgi:hypothetical protein